MGARYRYALDCNAQLLAIEDLRPEDRRVRAPFTCIGCERELLPKMGPIVAHHFAHWDSDVCSVESYRHRLAKRVFSDTYARCLSEKRPFSLSLSRTRSCDHFESAFGFTCRSPYVETIDLTRYFDCVDVERERNGFRADVLLHSSTNENFLFVEFAVTHLSTAEKRGSGIRILEIRIDSEDDVAELERATLDASSERVQHFNFLERGPADLCRGACSRSVNVILVHPRGKCALADAPVGAAVSGEFAPWAVWSKVVYPPPRDEEEETELFKGTIRAAAFDGTPVRDCYVCRHHGIGTSLPIFCKKLRKPCDSTEAVVCEHYWRFSSMQQCEEADARNVAFVQAKAQRDEQGERERQKRWMERTYARKSSPSALRGEQARKSFLEHEAEWRRTHPKPEPYRPTPTPTPRADAGVRDAPVPEVDLQHRFPL